jgi:regulatory protein
VNRQLRLERTENKDAIEALRYALRLLGYRDRSAAEIRQKLYEKGFAKDVSDDTLALLQEKGYIDDRKFAELVKSDAIERRHFGPQGVKRLLLKKGIPPEIMNVMAAVADEEYAGAARRLVEKKLRSMGNCSEDMVKRRLWGLLSRRGFAQDQISKVLKDYFE